MLTDVDHSMKVMRDETFGPVVGIMKVRDADEAVRLANDTRYGLAASVFGSKREAEAVARRLEVGTANVNDVLVGFLASDVPMGGWKDSGIGFRHGEYGIKKFVRPESIVISRFGQTREPLYFPYTDKRRQQLRKVSDFFAAATRDWEAATGAHGRSRRPRLCGAAAGGQTLRRSVEITSRRPPARTTPRRGAARRPPSAS